MSRYTWYLLHGKNLITKFDDLLFLENIPFLTRMMQNWTKTITRKNEDDQKFQKKYTKDIINGHVYIEKIS
jgi:hypothetical protein